MKFEGTIADYKKFTEIEMKNGVDSKQRKRMIVEEFYWYHSNNGSCGADTQINEWLEKNNGYEIHSVNTLTMPNDWKDANDGYFDNKGKVLVIFKPIILTELVSNLREKEE